MRNVPKVFGWKMMTLKFLVFIICILTVATDTSHFSNIKLEMFPHLTLQIPRRVSIITVDDQAWSFLAFVGNNLFVISEWAPLVDNPASVGATSHKN